MKSDLHDAYAAQYDRQVGEYGCHSAEVLFGLCYEGIQPGQLLLEAGIGSGLCAALFAKAGLVIHGFDFSPAMLEICREKGIAADLKQHDLLQAPWPYLPKTYDILISCGVFHFIAEMETVFGEAECVLRPAGIFAFTTKVTTGIGNTEQKYAQQMNGEFEIFSHSQSYIELLLRLNSFDILKGQQCLVGADVFQTWVTRKQK